MLRTKLALTVLSLSLLALPAVAQQLSDAATPVPPGYVLQPGALVYVPQPSAAVQPLPPVIVAAETPANGPAADAAQLAPQPHTVGNVTFVSGGVGEEGKAAMLAMQAAYNMRLLFAWSAGNYLGDVTVSLRDSQGNELLNTMAEGPYFYARVNPGTYRISAIYDGRELSRTITVPTGGAASQSMYWASLN